MVALKFANRSALWKLYHQQSFAREVARCKPQLAVAIMYRIAQIAGTLLTLDSIASFPCKENEDCYQSKHDKHPILDLESQKSKMLNQKPHRFRPLLMQDKDFSGRNILFRYLLRCRGPHEPAALCQVSDNLPAAR
jgi:hypothetical protein